MSQDPLNPDPVYSYNPKHVAGTCAQCGEEMAWNVPRLGPNGGFVHKSTGRYECQTQDNRPFWKRLLTSLRPSVEVEKIKRTGELSATVEIKGHADF